MTGAGAILTPRIQGSIFFTHLGKIIRLSKESIYYSGKLIHKSICVCFIDIRFFTGQGQPCQTQGHAEGSEGRDLSCEVQESAGQESDALEKVVATAKSHLEIAKSRDSWIDLKPGVQRTEQSWDLPNEICKCIDWYTTTVRRVKWLFDLKRQSFMGPDVRTRRRILNITCTKLSV